MRHKKGGIGSLIVLMGIVSVAFLILGLLSKEGVEPVAVSKAQVLIGFNHTLEGASDFTNLCLNRSVVKNLLIYGRRGGVMELTSSFLPTAKTSILLEGSKAVIPSLETAQDILAKSISPDMEQCIAGFSPFVNRGFEISEEGNSSVRVEISEDLVTAYYTHPFTISQGKKQKSYQNFMQVIPVHLKEMIETSGDILRFAQQRDEDADLSMLKDANVETIFFTIDGATVMVLRDMDNNLEGAPYEMWVGMRR